MSIQKEEEVWNLRQQGYTLQEVGDKYGVSKQAVWQRLVRRYRTTKVPNLLAREAFAKFLGCTSSKLMALEEKGLVKPIHYNYTYLYRRYDAGKVAKLLIKPPPVALVELTCEVCGGKFYRKPYWIRPNSPGRFCSKKCQGANWGCKNGRGGKNA